MSCATHSIMETGLCCGRCERAICARCIVHTAVGLRCTSCAQPNATRQFRADSVATITARPTWSMTAPTTIHKVLIALAVAAVAYLTASWLRGDHDGVIIKVIVFGGWLLSVSLHEYSHGITAYYGGDTGIKRRGYLTLNPLRFVNPLLTVIVPVVLILFGSLPLMGGVTSVYRDHLRNRWWDSAVSLAGPAANLGFALALALVLWTAPLDPASPVAAGLAFLAVLQICAALFNVIPWPPLDGFGAVAPHLPAEIAALGCRVGQWGYLLLFAIFAYVPAVSSGFWSRVYLIAERLHLPAEAIYNGFWGTRLW